MAGLQYVGELSIAGLCPLVVEANAAVLAQLQAQLAGVLELQASLSITPPTLSANLDAAIALVAALEAGLSIGLPGIDFQFQAVAALIASLNAQLALLLSLEAILGATVMAWVYSGPANSLGPALTGELQVQLPDGTPSAAPINGIVLVTPSPTAWVSVKTFFGGV